MNIFTIQLFEEHEKYSYYTDQNKPKMGYKKNALLEELRKEITPEDRIFSTNYYDLVIRINELLGRKEWTQKDFAEKLGKRPSEISKWLNGGHNLTLKSIAKMEAVLGENLIVVPQHKNPITTVLETAVSSSKF